MLDHAAVVAMHAAEHCRRLCRARKDQEPAGADVQPRDGEQRRARPETQRLLNLLWDRAVKLLRYKEQSGKTAAQLPINDPKNLEV